MATHSLKLTVSCDRLSGFWVAIEVEIFNPGTRGRVSPSAPLTPHEGNGRITFLNDKAPTMQQLIALWN